MNIKKTAIVILAENHFHVDVEIKDGDVIDTFQHYMCGDAEQDAADRAAFRREILTTHRVVKINSNVWNIPESFGTKGMVDEIIAIRRDTTVEDYICQDRRVARWMSKMAISSVVRQTEQRRQNRTNRRRWQNDKRDLMARVNM